MWLLMLDFKGSLRSLKRLTRSDFAGSTNPNYILYTDYYGDVYAKYVGPYDGYIAYSIWGPKDPCD